LNKNYTALVDSLGMTNEHAVQLARNSFAASFISDEAKAGFNRQIDDYLNAHRL
jgi:adenosine deaminase